MPLTGKYLKYSPEITLKIFTLIWDKLIENGCKFEYSKEIIFERFKFHNRVLRYDSNGNYVYPLTGNNSCKEITVQEILGYDPFVNKEIIPEIIQTVTKNPRITLWSIQSASVLRYLRKTRPEFSISKEASLLIDEAIREKYPEIWKFFEEIE